MIVAVTGASGFIGRKLLDRLVERGDAVRALTRHPASHASSPAVEWHRCDLANASAAELARILDGVEVLYHCAGQLTDARAMRA